jgi:hypothetical protein
MGFFSVKDNAHGRIEQVKLLPTIRMGKMTIPSPRSVQIKSIPLQSAPIAIPNSLNKNGIGLKLNDRLQTFDPKNRKLYSSS